MYSESTTQTDFLDNIFANKALKTSNFFSWSDTKNLKDEQ